MTWADTARRRLAAAGAALLVLLAAVLARPGDPRLPAAPAAGTWQTPAGALGWQLSAAGGFAVTDGETTIWQADPAWRVTGALTGDLDADGADELALLVWRRGFYGPSRPFWREADAAGRVYTQHIFLYDWQPDGVQPFWMSSGLDPQVAAWAIADDGTLAIRTAGGEDTRWAWRSWGLERIDAPARKM